MSADLYRNIDRVLNDIVTGEVDFGQNGERHKWHELGEIVDSGEIRDMIGYIKRLEKMALESDCYRCDACEFVFDINDIKFGEDCHLCGPCYDQMLEASTA